MAEQKTKGEKWLSVGVFGWFVRYEYTPTWLDFWAYEALTECSDGTKEFRDKNDPRGVEFTADPDQAECVSGFVKWDGCCEITMPDRPHFCGRGDVADFAKLLVELHGLCLLLPNVDRNCAGYSEDKT